jgi:hypothetical protein
MGVPAASRSWPFSWLDKEEQQHGRKRDNERGADERRGSCVEGIRERIFEDVKPPAKKSHHDESGEAPESAREPSANDERLGATRARSVMDDAGTHGSILVRIAERGRRLRESQEIEIAKDRRGVNFL